MQHRLQWLYGLYRRFGINSDRNRKIHRLGLSHIVATDLDSMISLVDVIRAEQTVLDGYLSDFERFIDDSDRENYEAILSKL